MAFPLEGVRILDLTRLIVGPICTMMLADHGAEVIKIEMPPHGDAHRTVGNPDEFLGGEGLHFLAANRNKKSMLLNLKDAEDRAIFHELVKKADIVVDNYRPGVVDRLGVDYQTLKKINPKIISCSLSGFGTTSVDAQRAAFDPVIQALSGFMSVTRDATGRPLRTGVAIGDFVPAVCAAYSITLALLNKNKTGEGCRLDISMMDCMISLLAYYATDYLAKGHIPHITNGGHVSTSPWGSFKTRDGYIVLAVAKEYMWKNFCKVIGREDLAADPRFEVNNKRKANEPALIAEIDATLQTWDTAELEAALVAVDVVCSRVQDVKQVLESQHVKDRNMIVHVDHPKAGRFGMAGNFVNSDMTSEPRLEPPPMAGQHTAQVLTDLLGYTDAQVRQFLENQASKAPAASAANARG